MQNEFWLQASFVSSVGRRTVNEDSALTYVPRDAWTLAHKGALFAVADGIGGHNAGQVASRLALQTMVNAFYSDPSTEIQSSLERAIQTANEQVWQRAASRVEWRGMGTTLLAVIVRGNQVYVGNVGDSRAYLLRGANFWQVTRDHSYAAELAGQSRAFSSRAGQTSWNKILSRAIGSSPRVRADFFQGALHAGDALLLVTDGVSDTLSAAQLRSILSRANEPQASAQFVVANAYRRGSDDNITCVVIQCLPVAKSFSQSQPTWHLPMIPQSNRGAVAVSSQSNWLYFWVLAFGSVIITWLMLAAMALGRVGH